MMIVSGNGTLDALVKAVRGESLKPANDNNPLAVGRRAATNPWKSAIVQRVKGLPHVEVDFRCATEGLTVRIFLLDSADEMGGIEAFIPRADLSGVMKREAMK